MFRSVDQRRNQPGLLPPSLAGEACPRLRPAGREGERLAEAGVPIVRSGALAREFCRQVAHAEVAAVFERSIYLRSGDMFVCLGEPGIGNGPLTLIADFRVPPPQPSPASGGGGAPSLWRDLGLHPGQSASISDRCITIG